MTRQQVNRRALAPAAASGFAQWGSRSTTICLLLAAITLAVFWPVAGYDFISLDDPVYVSENPHVSGGLAWGNVAWAFQTVEGGSWNPVTWLSLMVDGQFFGLRPSGYHLTNVLLHLANTLLLFGVLRQMTGATWRSALVAAPFAVHPLHVESVVWISERKDVLSTMFWLSTLWAYAQYTARRDAAPGAPDFGAQFWYGATLVLFALGLLSKPMLVTLPLVLLLLDFWPLQRVLRFAPPVAGTATPFPARRMLRLVREKVPFFIFSAGTAAATLWAQSRSGAVASFDGAPLGGRVGNGLVSYARYLGKTFWPAQMAVYYPHRWDWDWLAVLAAAVLLAGVSAAAWHWRRSHPFLATGWFWFVGTLVPVIGLVQVGGQSMADRYTYVPLIGIFIALTWGTSALLKSALASPAQRRFVGTAAGLLVLGCAVQAGGQVRHWQNSETLFRHALTVTTNNELAHNNLAAWLVNHGQWDEAAEHARRALELRPESTEALNNLGMALAGQGRPAEAMTHYRRALELKPNDEHALNSLGLALASQGQLAEATEHFRRSLQARPESAEVLNNLGLALVLQGRLDEAIPTLRHARQLRPNHPQILNNLGIALASQGQPEEARACFEGALRAQPDYVEAHARLGQVLAKIGRRDEARAHLAEALRLQPGNLEIKAQLDALSAPVAP